MSAIKLPKNPVTRELLSQDILNEWQSLLDETADILGVPAGLITRVDGNEIEILLSSHTEGNPYPADFISQYPGSGWYCEYTLKSRAVNLIPNALREQAWKDNEAAVKLGIISYAGMPIQRPDGGTFGTVCFLDNKSNAHNDLHLVIIKQVKRMIELSLRVVMANAEVKKCDRFLDDLSKIYPICSYCKKVREDSGEWVSVEKYVNDISGAKPTHSICPDCLERELSKFEE